MTRVHVSPSTQHSKVYRAQRTQQPATQKQRCLRVRTQKTKPAAKAAYQQHSRVLHSSVSVLHNPLQPLSHPAFGCHVTCYRCSPAAHQVHSNLQPVGIGVGGQGCRVQLGQHVLPRSAVVLVHRGRCDQVLFCSLQGAAQVLLHIFDCGNLARGCDGGG